MRLEKVTSTTLEDYSSLRYPGRKISYVTKLNLLLNVFNIACRESHQNWIWGLELKRWIYKLMKLCSFFLETIHARRRESNHDGADMDSACWKAKNWTIWRMGFWAKADLLYPVLYSIDSAFTTFSWKETIKGEKKIKSWP